MRATYSRSGRPWLAADRPVTVDKQDEYRVVKDMTISHREFFRIVQRLLEGERHELRADGVTLLRDAGSIAINLPPESFRSMGAIRLPRTGVELVFRGCSSEEVGAFLVSFDNRFRRGGG